jgi:hypothetical protein
MGLESDQLCCLAPEISARDDRHPIKRRCLLRLLEPYRRNLLHPLPWGLVHPSKEFAFHQPI